GGPFGVVLVLPVEHHLHGLGIQHPFTVEFTTVEQGKHEAGHVVGGGDSPTGRSEQYPIVYGHGPVQQVQGNQIVSLGTVVELTELGNYHPQMREDVFVHVFLEGLPTDLLHDQTGQAHPVVGVGTELPRGKDPVGGGLTQELVRAPPRSGVVGVVPVEGLGEPGGVREQVVYGHRLLGVGVGDPYVLGQVGGDVLVQVDVAALDELEYGHGREGLGDRCGREGVR